MRTLVYKEWHKWVLAGGHLSLHTYLYNKFMCSPRLHYFAEIIIRQIPSCLISHVPSVHTLFVCGIVVVVYVHCVWYDWMAVVGLGFKATKDLSEGIGFHSDFHFFLFCLFAAFVLTSVVLGCIFGQFRWGAECLASMPWEICGNK